MALVGLAAKVLRPHLLHILERSPSRPQEGTPEKRHSKPCQLWPASVIADFGAMHVSQRPKGMQILGDLHGVLSGLTYDTADDAVAM